MEAGKERVARDTVRDAAQQEVQALRRQNVELKQSVAELSLEVSRLKKRLFRWPMPPLPPTPTDERCGKGGGAGQGGFLRSKQRSFAGSCRQSGVQTWRCRI